MKCILGKKIGMTQVFLPTGEVMPVTKIKAGPCQITMMQDGAVQLGFDETKETRLSKPRLGYLKGLKPFRVLKVFKMENVDKLKRGDMVSLATFTVGDKIDVTGISKGKGFAGVVKRHHFAGGPASHGHKDNLRAPGSIGVGGVQKVFKGMRMAGHMGVDQVTIKNLEVVAIDMENNEMLIKGAVPGGRNGIVSVAAKGDLKIVEIQTEPEAKIEEAEAVQSEPEVVVEENITEEAIEEKTE
jgi:large subunit ribosomal protein L3